jgi:hypothetical protein
VRISLMQFVTDLTPPPQAVAAWAEERGFAALYVPEKTHVPMSRQTPWPGGELPDRYRRCYDPFVALAAAAAVTTRLLPALPMLHAAFEKAGRDPSSAQVCVYSSAGKPRTLDAYLAAGISEVALTLPSAGRSDVLSALDRLAPLASEFGPEVTSHA